MGNNDTEKGKYKSPEGSKTWEYLATFACSFLLFCVGSAMGWNSPSSVKLTAEDSAIHLKSSELSTLMSLIAIGQMIAPPLNSIVVDRIGRRKTILLTGLPLLASWFLIALFENVTALYVARFAAGLSQGMSYCVCYMYVGEIASTSTRGAANVLVMIMLNLGMLMAFVIGPPLTISANACFNLVLVAFFLVIFWFMPESPYFLMMAGHNEEAEFVLEKIRGRNDVSEEMEVIERSLRSIRKMQESQKSPSMKTLFTNRASLKVIIIIGLFSVTHHFGGYMAVMMYGQKIFKDLNVEAVSDYLANVINGVVQLISVALTSLFVDRWGRKPLIAVSGVLAGFCNLVVGIYFYLQEYTSVDVSAYSLLPLAALFLTVFAFNCGLLIVQGIYMSEMFAPEVKALGICLTTINGGFMFTVGTKFYLMIADTWHYGHSPPFLSFTLVVWCVTATLLYITPETKGKNLLEIQAALID